MPLEHVIFGKQSAFGTVVVPAKAIPMISFEVAVGRERLDGRYTGSGRALRQRYMGAKAPTGSMESVLWSENMGIFLEAMGLTLITTSTPGGATNARLHCFLPNDATLTAGMTAQAKQTATHALTVLGLVIDKATFSAVAKEECKFSADWLAKDETRISGTWDFDGSAAPAIVASPTYFSQLLRPFIFYDAVITTGGTPALDPTTKRMSIGSGTAQTRLEKIEISLENGTEMPHFLVADETPGLVFMGDRTIKGKFDLDLTTMSTAFYDDCRAGTKRAIQLQLTAGEIETGKNYIFEITLPSVDFDMADYPAVSGDQSRRVMTVEFTAIQDSVTGYDIGIAIQDSQTGY